MWPNLQSNQYFRWFVGFLIYIQLYVYIWAILYRRKTYYHKVLFWWYVNYSQYSQWTSFLQANWDYSTHKVCTSHFIQNNFSLFVQLIPILCIFTEFLYRVRYSLNRMIIFNRYKYIIAPFYEFLYNVIFIDQIIFFYIKW